MAWLAAARQLVPVSSLSDIVSEYAGLLLLNVTGASGLVQFEVNATGLVPGKMTSSGEAESLWYCNGTRLFVQEYRTFEVPLFGHVEVPLHAFWFVDSSKLCKAWLCPYERPKFLPEGVSAKFARVCAFAARPDGSLYLATELGEERPCPAPCGNCGMPLQVWKLGPQAARAPQGTLADGSLVLRFSMVVSAKLGAVVEGADGVPRGKQDEHGAPWVLVSGPGGRLVAFP